MRLFVLTVYPKKGGNIQVVTKVSRSPVVETPVKTHRLSLATALAPIEEGKAACSISDKVECITQKTDVLYLASATPCFSKKKLPYLRMIRVLWRYIPYLVSSHLQLFRARQACCCTRSAISKLSYLLHKSRSLLEQYSHGILETGQDRLVGRRIRVHQQVVL